MLDLIKKLLPNARAWRLPAGSTIRAFFQGLTGLPNGVKAFADNVWLDLFPSSTTQLTEWEHEFGLPDTSLTTSQRRTRLANAWSSQGGQTVGYIQDTLQGAGFDVYVTESIFGYPGVGVPGCVNFLNPLTYLAPAALNPVPPLGYALPNGTYITGIIYTCLAGEAFMEAGEPDAEAGQYAGYLESRTPHVVVNDPATNPFYLYIGGAAFPALAQIPQVRRQEFEELCLKLRPAPYWLGLLVEYV